MRSVTRIHTHGKMLEVRVYRYGPSSGYAAEIELCQGEDCTSMGLHFDSFEEATQVVAAIGSAIQQSIPLKLIDGELVTVVRYLNQEQKEET